MLWFYIYIYIYIFFFFFFFFFYYISNYFLIPCFYYYYFFMSISHLFYVLCKALWITTVYEMCYINKHAFVLHQLSLDFVTFVKVCLCSKAGCGQRKSLLADLIRLGGGGPPPCSEFLFCFNNLSIKSKRIKYALWVLCFSAVSAGILYLWFNKHINDHF